MVRAGSSAGVEENATSRKVYLYFFLLVAALMVLPVSAAGRVAWSLRSAFALALAVGLASSLAGLTIAYYADLPPGATIVLAAAAAFALATAAGALRGR